MKRGAALGLISIASLLLTIAAAAQRVQPLAIADPPELRCVVQQSCSIQLRATGGRVPARWRIVDGKLPAGFELNIGSGLISGKAQASGDFALTVEVADASAQRVQRRIVISIVDILSAEWRRAPVLNGGKIGGTLRVISYSADPIDITVIVVAINERGRATTLGYQHFTMTTAGSSPDISYGLDAILAAGKYQVRVDAVGEVPSKNAIYKSALDAGPFTIE